MEQERETERILQPIFNDEMRAILARRKKINPECNDAKPDELFGIALSGGGIRSATINLGVLEVLNKCGIFQLADYLSTVSGGGYIGGYVHATLSGNDCQKKANELGQNGSYASLFNNIDIEYLKKFGGYLAPETGIRNCLNRLRLAGAFAASFIMNVVWILALFFTIVFVMQCLYSCHLHYERIIYGLLIASGVILLYHFFVHPLRYLSNKLWDSNVLNCAEGALLLFVVLFSPYYLLKSAGQHPLFCYVPYAPLALLVTGLFANPNLLTLHRFYRDRIADAFMPAAGKGDRGLKLRELVADEDPDKWHCAPYPLINTCLNLQGVTDKKFKGTKTCDYFLLSPLYCGSTRTGYAKTNTPGYSKLTLSTAVAVSGAAVSPEMGTSTNKVLAFLMTLLNLRLGYWAANPKYVNRSFIFRFVWWPYYHIMELISKTDTRKRRVNISDGGHIENLAVYELLRRKCRLIIAIDAGADPEYGFSDLKNLVIRARNELGLEIKFKEAPEKVIAPAPSEGFSKQHYVIADIVDMRELPNKSKDGAYKGLLVYIKSSMLAGNWKVSADDSYFYKTYHPAFPHESTADQFFDEIQWTAYYKLGKYIAGKLLDVEVEKDPRYWERISIKCAGELYSQFDKHGGFKKTGK